MNAKEITRRSRKLNLVLRHQPDAIGLELDRHGWADVTHLLKRLAATGTPTTRQELETVVAENDKQRFSFSADGRRIRANQGHSIDVDLQLTAVDPPERLFHGTATRFLEAILAEGLSARSRQHVHLSADPDTAVTVGSRHGRPVVLGVNAAAMVERNHVFYRSANGVWLTDAVPAEYLEVLEYGR